MKVLVIDDELSILNLIRLTLELENYSVLTASNGKEALRHWEEKPDMILLDLMLPDKDGYELFGIFRKQDAHIPIIMLTAKSQINDKLLGLQIGADDYITKPFHSTELLLRMKAIERRILARSLTKTAENLLQFRSIRLYSAERKAFVNNEEISLTYREFDLLRLFIINKQRVFTRDELLTKVWGIEYIGHSRAVDIMIQRLRKKLGANGNDIKTIYGVGYKLEE
ncbi:response regulator transcription factor [Priestia aryabhattai]|uniref:response regulator transcription factor n=1 Tax=Priestia aryabhattai TaxID=412384 RepID=UPI001CCF81E5|nr:response regulator transcription factor [Priestia aryabhattai]MBZ6485049.1 response regulator transcription factor [Priestia aryabhattai]